MNNKYRNIIALLAVLMLIAIPLAGCSQSGSVQDDLEKDLGGDLADEIAGGEIDTKNVWPDSMPDKVPVFTDGTIVNTSGILVGGQKNITIVIESASQEAVDAYIAELENSVFNLLTDSTSGGIAAKTYVEGENAVSIQYAAKTGELTISFTGN